MCYDTIWTLLLQPYPNSTSNSKIRKYFFPVLQFLGFIPQSSIIRTQTIIHNSFVPAGRSRSVALRPFKSILTRIVCSQSSTDGKFYSGLVITFTESMADFYFVPRNIFTNMVHNSADSGLKLIMFNQRRYAHNLHTFSTGVLCIFPALTFYWTQLLNQIIIHLLHYNDFRLKLFETTMYFFNFFRQSVYCVICLFLSLQEKFNDLCLIQRLQFLLSINSSHNVNENVTGLKEY